METRTRTHVDEEVFIPNTRHQSPSAMTRNNYLIFVLIGWFPGCGYISARGKRNNITCVRIYTYAKGIPRSCVGCFRLTALLIDDHNSTWPRPPHKTSPQRLHLYYIILIIYTSPLMLYIITVPYYAHEPSLQPRVPLSPSPVINSFRTANGPIIIINNITISHIIFCRWTKYSVVFDSSKNMFFWSIAYYYYYKR